MRPELSTWNSVVDNFPSPFGTFGPFDEHLCPSGGKTRTAKNSDGSDLHLLSARSNRAYHLLIHFTKRDIVARTQPFRALGEGFMKDNLTMLLASVFVLFSLIVLLSAARTPDHRSLTLDNGEQKVSDLGLRFAFKR